MNAKQDLQSHPNYAVIYGLLLALVFISFGFYMIKSKVIATALIFLVAFIKAAMVGSFFMHLKFEPKTILTIVLSSLFVVVLVLFGLIPDIVYQFGRM